MTKLRPGSRVCYCRACGRYFGGLKGFDMHRVGVWERRICLDPAAVVDKLQRRRLWLNELGRWVSDYNEGRYEQTKQAI